MQYVIWYLSMGDHWINTVADSQALGLIEKLLKIDKNSIRIEVGVVYMSTVTVSFSLDKETKKSIDQMAKRAKKSRSDILRDMARSYEMHQDWKSVQEYAQAKGREFNLQTEDDIEKFLG